MKDALLSQDNSPQFLKTRKMDRESAQQQTTNARVIFRMHPQFLRALKLTALLSAAAVGMIVLSACSTLRHPTRPPVETVHTTQAATVLSLIDRHVYSERPVRSTYPNSWTVLESIGYESAYDETFRNPAWVAYRLRGTPKDVAPRQSGYTTDTRTTSQVRASDYPGGYHHGHLAPNQAIAIFYGADAQKETFLMTNMLPQKGGLNTGPWKSVETLEYKKWQPTYREVWVIAGPIYTETNNDPIQPAERYGAKRIGIPVACFKIVFTKDQAGRLRTLAFIMPQSPGTGRKPREFLKSIREIERRTGLNFFSSLPLPKQDEIELAVAADVWP